MGDGKKTRRTFTLSCSIRPTYGKNVEDKVKKISGVDKVRIYIDGKIMEVMISGTVSKDTVKEQLEKKYPNRDVKIKPAGTTKLPKVAQSHSQPKAPNQRADPKLNKMVSNNAPDKSVGMKTFDCCPNQNRRLILLTCAKQFTCDEYMEYGFGSRYKCTCGECVYELHLECCSPKTTISSELFKGPDFKFCRQPEKSGSSPGRMCDACGNDICGYSYRFEKLDFHPRCSNLPSQVRIGGTDFDLCRKKERKCTWCKKKRRGYRYVCNLDKKFKLHVNCITEIAHEAWKKKAIDKTDEKSMALEKVNLEKMVAKSNSNGGTGDMALYGKILKVLLQTIISVLFGSPTALIGSMVELLGPLGSIVESLFPK